MRHFVYLLLVVVGITLSASAQSQQRIDKPDYLNIEKVTKDPKLRSFYPKLFTRYSANDTTLNIDEYYLLYYGYFFRDSYQPMGTISPLVDSLRAIYMQAKVSNDDRQKLIRYSKELLKAEPFSIRYLGILFKTYHELGDDASSLLYQYKVEMIVRTVFSSVDGKTSETGVHVLSVADEYALLELIGLEFDGQSTTENHCDYLRVKPNGENIEGMFFDVSEIFKKYSAMFKEKGKAQKSKKI